MFSNQQIDISTLPQIDHLQYTQLQKEYLNVEMIGLGILWVIIFLTVFGTSFIYTDDTYVWIRYVLLAVVAIFATLSMIITKMAFKRKKFALRERDIIYMEGLLWRKHTVIPFNRIQHAEVTQGPIDRLFDLSKLKVYTAGGSSSDLYIPGLLPIDAERMKHYILNRTVRDEEE